VTASLQLPRALRLARYRFTIRALDPVNIPPRTGGTLRGGFGYALRRQVCCRAEAHCLSCDLRSECVYSYLFRTSPPEDAEVLSNLTAVARPFVIQPTFDGARSAQPGDRLDFHVVLVGRAVGYAPYFVFAFQQLGTLGLGKLRSRFRLELVTSVGLEGESAVFRAADGVLRGDGRDIEASALKRAAEVLDRESLDVAFLTPTRLKHRGQYVRRGPPFHVLVRRLLDRVSSLSYFHCGERWEIDFRGWIERAKEVETADEATRWEDWDRYSGRQDQRIKMGGLVGPVAYVGDVAPFRALLALGTLIHVGKGTVMGNGRFAVKGLDTDLCA
jgi:hypothetical protein